MTGPASPVSRTLLLAALFVLSLNLRSPVTSVAPIIPEIQADLQINKATAGLLTSIPVLCFGLLAPLASRCIAATSVESSMLITVFGTLAGIIIRSSGHTAMAMIGTFVIGASIAIGNIVSLVVIARDFPDRKSQVMGLYTSGFSFGPMLTAALAQPLASAAGWRWSLMTWSLFSICAAILWVRIAKASVSTAKSTTLLPEAAPVAASGGHQHVLRRPVVWLLTVAFTFHLTIFYSLTAWLPDFLREQGGLSPSTAGIAASMFQLSALIGTIGVPALSQSRRLSNPAILLLLGLGWFITPPGYYLMPSLWPLWAIFGGTASGGGITVIFMIGMNNARDLVDNRQISTAVQGLGYTLAAAGPVLIGYLNETTHSWGPSFLLLTGCAMIVMLVATLLMQPSTAA